MPDDFAKSNNYYSKGEFADCGYGCGTNAPDLYDESLIFEDEDGDFVDFEDEDDTVVYGYGAGLNDFGTRGDGTGCIDNGNGCRDGNIDGAMLNIEYDGFIEKFRGLGNGNCAGYGTADCAGYSDCGQEFEAWDRYVEFLDKLNYG